MSEPENTQEIPTEENTKPDNDESNEPLPPQGGLASDPDGDDKNEDPSPPQDITPEAPPEEPDEFEEEDVPDDAEPDFEAEEVDEEDA